MALPVGEETRGPEACHCGNGCEPDPTISSAEAANRAEDNARRAAEGVGITDTLRPGRNQ